MSGTRAARFANVSCSQCGREFGPGDHGFSSCESHRQKAAHTPGPWVVRHRLNSVGDKMRGGRFVIIGEAQSTREEFYICECPHAAVRSGDEKECEANAAFIVRAVNSHDDLLAIAKDSLAAINNCYSMAAAEQQGHDRTAQKLSDAIGDFRVRVRAAIAKATGAA